MPYSFPNYTHLDLKRDKIDARIQELDEELRARIQALTEEIRNLKTQRNQVSPISVLPAELFSQVIRHLVTVDGSTSYKQLVTLSCVCQSWRERVLCDHALWTDIHTRFIGLAPLLLERCGMVPISLSIENDIDIWKTSRINEKISKALDLISIQRPLIKKLSLHHSLIREHFLPFLLDPAPRMVHCEMLGGTVTHPPRSLFAGSAPQLAILILEKVNFSWNMPLLYALPQLRELRIVEATDKPTLDQLHSILGPMTKLRSLELLGANVLPIPTIQPHISAIACRHVEILSIAGTAHECASFLDLTLFETAQSFTVLSSDMLKEETYLVFQPWLSNIWKSQDPYLPISTFSIGAVEGENRQEDIIHICVNTHHHDTHREAPLTKFDLAWTFRIGHEFEFMPDIESWLFQPLPLSGCRYFSSRLHLRSEALDTCIRKMRNLTEVTLSDLVSQTLTIPDRISVRSNVPLPYLSSLTIRRFLSDEEVGEFFAMLRSRKQKGFKLKYVAVGVVTRRRSPIQKRGEKFADRFTVLDYCNW